MRRMAARGTRRLLANLLLALASGIGFLALLEGGARLFGARTPDFLGPTQFNCLQPSRVLDVEFRPNCTGSTHDTPIRTNALGLRGPDVRDDDSIRILTIGDSCTWGWRVPQGESYPAQLQQLLDQDYGPGRYQVLNAGIPGSTSYHGLVYLRERGLALRPAIVIAAYGFNDMTRDGDVKAHFRLAHGDARLARLESPLIEHSRLYRWLRFNTDARLQPVARLPRVSASLYRRNFSQMVQLVRRDGAHFMLLDMTHTARDQEYPATLAAVSRDLAVPLVVYAGPRIDVVHPTPDGYRTLAQEVLATLRKDGYVPAGPSAHIVTTADRTPVDPGR